MGKLLALTVPLLLIIWLRNKEFSRWNVKKEAFV